MRVRKHPRAHVGGGAKSRNIAQFLGFLSCVTACIAHTRDAHIMHARTRYAPKRCAQAKECCILCCLYVVLYDRARKESIVTDAVSDKIPRNKSHKYLSNPCFTLCYTVDNYVFIKCYENFFLHL